jgi:metal-dependent amidase/aminoacylase/carboxypeptidase family protein
MQLIESILADAQAISALRRDIHAHPELCFEEVRTADLIAKALTDWDIPIQRSEEEDRRLREALNRDASRRVSAARGSRRR